MPLDYRARSRGDDVHFDRKGKAALQRRRDDEATVFGLSGRYLLPYLSIRHTARYYLNIRRDNELDIRRDNDAAVH